MNQYLLIPFLEGWTSSNPSYFDVNRRGTIGFDPLPSGRFSADLSSIMLSKSTTSSIVPDEAAGQQHGGIVVPAERWRKRIMGKL